MGIRRVGAKAFQEGGLEENDLASPPHHVGEVNTKKASLNVSR